MSAFARYSLVAFDCPDPRAHAALDSANIGWLPQRDDGDRLTPRSAGGPALAHRSEPDRVAPGWPNPMHLRQAHLCFDVDDLDPGKPRALALAAIKAEVQSGDGVTVFIDPAGHPFCLVLDGE